MARGRSSGRVDCQQRFLSSGAGGLLADLVIGVLGAIVGGFVMGLLTGQDYTTGINISTILVSVLGAIILIAVYRLATGQRVRT